MLPIVYRWDDGNAPVARAERRSLHDILYACLVTGYGNKPGAGWTRPYVNATFTISAFRNNPANGTGFYLRVNSSSPPYYSVSWLTAYETMTGYSSGLKPFNPAVVEALTGPNYSALDTTARPWVLIADDRAFYFVCWGELTAAPAKTDIRASATFFGDLVRQSVSDAYCCAICGASDLYGSYGQINPPSTAANQFAAGGFQMPRRASGALGAVVAAMIRGGGPSDDGHCGANGAPYAPGGPVYLARPHINNAEAYSFRAFVPGFYYPCHKKPFGQLEQVTIDGKPYLSLVHYLNYSSGDGAYLISLDDWRA